MGKQRKFPINSKLVNITPVFRKRYRGSKDNYRPESILPVISKVLEKLLCKQITLSLNQLLSKFRCGFWKNYGTQYCLLAIPEHWKSEIDEEKVLGALLTDLSNFFRKKKTSFIGRNSLWCSTRFDTWPSFVQYFCQWFLPYYQRYQNY